MEKTISILKKRRKNTIQILYRLFLLEEDINKIKQEVLDGFQLETFEEELNNYIFDILDNTLEYKALISNLLPELWNWTRLPKIIQAILVNGVYEIKKEITPKAVIINESIELTREYLPSFETAFVNGLLDNIK
ncbi:transcription antitermination protein NusB [Spiroplasma cantharicola]|uniref:Transcription antitermination protein NusB n=1 Tax=Spiroplasma cantharicola TaxID=362837 RepID=A0A0M4JWQ4_9MOLU|nr:transcription antitermination protein NusB [Spiroplasma cantharicola]ALD66430.1 transcription antitermination protein NusB [Spiroplasma cantharicola]